MQSNPQSPAPKPMPMRLEDFGQLQERYKSMSLAFRAKAVLQDAEPALSAAEDILKSLSSDRHIKQVFLKLRNNTVLSSRMRPSEAKNILMDSSSDYIECARHKLAAWRKTMERLSQGESITVENGKEYIPANAPLALAIAGTSQVSNYLSVMQLALMELSKTDSKHAGRYTATISDMRRCATLLSDCEVASAITTAIVN